LLRPDIDRHFSDGCLARRAEIGGNARCLQSSVLVLRHRFALPELDVAFTQDELRSEDFVVCSTMFDGGRFDQVPTLARGRRAHWSKALVVLEGHVFVGSGIARPGDVVVSRRWDDHRMRALDSRTRYVLCAWRHGHAGELPAASDVFRAPRASALAWQLSREPEPRRARLLATELASLGVPVWSDAPIAAPRADERHRRFARALEGTLFPLAARPMAIDLERSLGIGARQIQRLSAEYFERYYVTAVGWRQFVHGMRLEVGVFLASNPGSTTEALAGALGFASPTALCHAFHDARLPSPQSLKRELR